MILLRSLTPGQLWRGVPTGRLASAAARPGFAAHLKPGLLSLMDQGMVSAGNFVTGLVLARVLDKTDFGLYVLFNAVLWIPVQLQQSLILDPLAVNGAPLDGDVFRRFLRAMVPIQTITVLLGGLLVAAAGVVWSPLRPIVLPLVVTTLALQGQEFCRRVLYARAHVGSALFNDVINYDAQVVLVVGMAWTGALRLETALWTIAATSVLALLHGLWQLRRFETVEREEVGAVARRILHLGKWSATATGLGSASELGYTSVLTVAGGLPSTAGLGVLRQAVGPLHLLVRPLENYYLPRAARALAREGTPGLNRVLRSATLMTAPLYLAYALGLALFAEQALTLMAGDKYAQEADALRLFALAQALVLPVHLLALEVNARKMQKFFLVQQLWATLFTYSVGLYLIVRFGLIGAVATTTLMLAGNSAVFVAVVARARRREQQHARQD